MFTMRGRRYALLSLLAVSLTALVLISDQARRGLAMEWFDRYRPKPVAPEPVPKPRPPFYRPKPAYTPPPVHDPFPGLSTSAPPPIPPWNVPRKNLHKQYGIDYKPPLLIGFSRSWPLLLQTVVSYITAGWPADQITVVENTGVHGANAEGRLTLQNPYFLNHTQLAALGVNVVRTPVLMSFAQLQNFYMHLAQENNWPYYFWSHMDVLVLSYEDGNEMTGPALSASENTAHPGAYRTVYELCLAQMRRAVRSDERWAVRFFAYDHLALVNRAAYEDVGGWDTLIPYYMTDCDMHNRLMMKGWKLQDGHAGIVSDVGSTLENLLALYRDPSIPVKYVDPNPGPPPEHEGSKKSRRRTEPDAAEEESALEYWRTLKSVAEKMAGMKQEGERNTWQGGQRGGQGEPYHYNARGIGEGIEVLTEAGREVYRRKWGHQDCDLLGATDLKIGDQWLVEKDWE